MSEQNIERLRAVYLDWAQGNLRAGGELFAPEIVCEPIADGRAALVGGDAVAGFMREFLAQWSEFRIDAEEFVEVGETILVTERQHGTGKTSGAETEMTAYSAWTFREDLVVRLRWETDRSRALEAAGLSE